MCILEYTAVYTRVHTAVDLERSLKLRSRSSVTAVGSVQPECILGGLRFRGNAIRFFKFVWYFLKRASFGSVFPEKRLELKPFLREN
jgi:hypothetical protein